MRRFRDQFRELRRTIVWELLLRQWRWVVLLLALSGLSLAVTLQYANAIRDAIDLAVVEKSKPLGPYINAMIVAALAGFPVGVGVRQVTARIGYQIEYQVRVRLYEKLQALDPRDMDSVATGQLVTRAVTDLHYLELFVVIVPGLAAIVLVISSLAIVILVQNLAMGMLGLAAVPINAWLVMRIRYRLLGMSWVNLNRRAQVTTAIDEAVRGIRVVKAFSREDHERAKVAGAARSAYAVALNRIRLVARYDLILRILPAIFTAAEFMVAGRLIGGGNFTIGRLLVLLYLTQALTQFAQTFSEIADAWQAARAGATRITELLDLIPAASHDNPRPMPAPHDGLVLSKVSFRVSDGEPDLVTDVDLTVNAGALVVLHGAPGSGKTLVAALAAGRVAPTSGRVVLDGADLTDLDPVLVTAAVRLLAEEPFLFGRSVRENLTLGTVEASDETLWEALRVASADGFVSELESGLDATLGDRGMTLSGGQRQRLALARALVRPPRILVLDDALSAVNPAMEISIISATRVHAPGMGILCVNRREGVEALADAVTWLPDRLAGWESAHPDPVSAAETEPSLMDMAITLFGDKLNDPRLLRAISSVPPDRDSPPVTEDAATESETRPTVGTTLRPLARVAVGAVLLLMAATAVDLIPAGMSKLAVDDFREGTHNTADKVGLSFILTATIYGCLKYAYRLRAARVNEGVMYLLRRRTFQRLSRLGIEFYDRELPGQVASRVVYDLDRISSFLETGLYLITVNVTLLVMAMGVMFVWSPPVAAAVLPFVLVLLALSVAQAPIAQRAYDRQRQRLGRVVERLQEDMAGRHVIDAFGGRAAARAAFGERALDLRSARRISALVGVVYIELMNSVGFLAGAALIARAGRLAVDGRLSVGSMVALELYLLTALGPIPYMSEAVQKFMAARASFRTLRRPFEVPVLPVDRPDARPCGALAGEIDLRGVSFAYPGTERTVLHEVDLNLPARSSLAIVGPTGAGKSSIAKLAARIYDPDRGQVCADGVDLRDLEVTSYRRRLGIVPQDAFCFRASVADNIAYGRPDASREEIRAAVEAVGCSHVLASLPMGIWTQVEEEGRNLTAAQRQAIALARAALCQPDILILDEATSSLDSATEEAVLDALRRRSCTTIFITHRLPVAQRADRVAVVEGGRITEIGTHVDLIGQPGPYSQLWAAGEEVGEGSTESSARSSLGNGDGALHERVDVAVVGERPGPIEGVLERP